MRLLRRTPAPAEERTIDYEYDTRVAGMHLDERQYAGLKVKLGRPLTLVRERLNDHDPHAVALYHKGHQVGYIPQRYSRMAAEYMDAGRVVEATPTAFVHGTGILELGIAIKLTFMR